ncbi:nose resistant to fluoxetine protein 6-like isoform X2 [Varroa jacobsoni]|uniref:nose resistant to fluoxetine protein 6-like isoform X2 n=1 Tax=Varroa jacobsoni TaxID=62625 RepID=UPI000BF56C9F|nr:nose resistant to fluoxetine protein 6-like isoform X2 [Varroa jacobsoni]
MLATPNVSCYRSETKNESFVVLKTDDTTTTEEPTTTLVPVRQAWAKLENGMKKVIDEQLRKFLPRMLRASSEADMSAECQAANFKLFQGLRGLKAWAFQMIDASGRPSAGMLTGTLTDFGNYDECLRVRVQDDDDGNEIYRGKYCTLKFTAPLPPRPKRIHYDMDIWATLGDNHTLPRGGLLEHMAPHSIYFYHLNSQLGICIPSECSSDDIKNLANIMLKSINWTVAVSDCDVDEDSIEVRPGQKIAIVALGTMAVLTILGTIVTALYRVTSGADETHRPSGFLMAFFCAFSVYENSVRLFSTRQQPGTLSVMHGIKFFSICWVILCHAYIFTNPEVVVSLQNIQREPFKWSFQLLMSGWLAVDTFFMLGALTLAYGSMKYMQQHNGKLSIFMYFFHRLWRLVPPLGFSICIMVVLPLLGRGPLWKKMVEYQGLKCESSWWQTLLFIANWSTSYETLCLETTWYLQCDLQLYATALLVILPMYRRPALATLINIGLLLVSIAIFMVVVIKHDFPPIMIFLHPDIELIKEEAHILYYRPYTHYGPYAVGLFMGYLMFKTPKWRTNTLLVVIGWIIAMGGQWAIIYGILPWHHHYDSLGLPQYLYAATHRTLWSITVAYIVWAVHFGYGGWIGQFLTWKAFVPLSRLVFMTYLAHPIVMYYKRGAAKERFYLRHFPEMTWQYLGDTLFSFGCAYAMSMMFEVPIINLEKIILKPLLGGGSGRDGRHRMAERTKRANGRDLSRVYRQDIDMNSREYQMDQMAITGYRRTIPERL